MKKKKTLKRGLCSLGMTTTMLLSMSLLSSNSLAYAKTNSVTYATVSESSGTTTGNSTGQSSGSSNDTVQGSSVTQITSKDGISSGTSSSVGSGSGNNTSQGNQRYASGTAQTEYEKGLATIARNEAYFAKSKGTSGSGKSDEEIVASLFSTPSTDLGTAYQKTADYGSDYGFVDYSYNQDYVSITGTSAFQEDRFNKNVSEENKKRYDITDPIVTSDGKGDMEIEDVYGKTSLVYTYNYSDGEIVDLNVSILSSDDANFSIPTLYYAIIRQSCMESVPNLPK